jgi:hypothetical protein
MRHLFWRFSSLSRLARMFSDIFLFAYLKAAPEKAPWAKLLIINKC